MVGDRIDTNERVQEIRDVRGTCAVRANTKCVKAVESKASPNGSNSIPRPHDGQDHGAGNLTVAHVWAFGGVRYV